MTSVLLANSLMNDSPAGSVIKEHDARDGLMESIATPSLIIGDNLYANIRGVQRRYLKEQVGMERSCT